MGVHTDTECCDKHHNDIRFFPALWYFTHCPSHAEVVSTEEVCRDHSCAPGEGNSPMKITCTQGLVYNVQNCQPALTAWLAALSWSGVVRVIYFVSLPRAYVLQSHTKDKHSHPYAAWYTTTHRLVTVCVCVCVRACVRACVCVCVTDPQSPIQMTTISWVHMATLIWFDPGSIQINQSCLQDPDRFCESKLCNTRIQCMKRWWIWRLRTGGDARALLEV